MMADSDQQVSAPLGQSQSPSLLADIVSDSYTLLLVVGLLVLLVSLAVLTSLWFGHYGLGPKPVIGRITSISANQIHPKPAEPGHDGPRIILAKGDTVVFSPSDSAGRVLWA